MRSFAAKHDAQPLLLLRSALAVLAVLAAASFSWAAPVDPNTAGLMVRGWLKTDPQPMGRAMRDTIVLPAQAHDIQGGQPNFYVVPLNPEGFVLVPGDDTAEPVVGFQNTGTYVDDPQSPLTALVVQDMRGRMAKADRLETRRSQGLDVEDSSAANNVARWKSLLAVAAEKGAGRTGAASISDVRVDSLVQSCWSQSSAGGQPTYNYYTPSNYVCGCVATAMAQLMRFHQHPTVGVGTASFTIYVAGVSQGRNLRGGDGSGGAYAWASMPLAPASGVTLAQRQAIGALTHDAGVSVNMKYTASSSGADTSKAYWAYLNVFGYTRAVPGYSGGANFTGTALNTMTNPNLDAGYPVLLGITGPSGGHAIVCDGYGYQAATLYHHLNMGWAGSHDMWYNLPTIDTSYTFNSVYKCVYNVFPDKTGEIISGRISDTSGNPLAGVTVTAVPSGGGASITDTTNAKGIYGLAGVQSGTQYTVTPVKAGYHFEAQSVSTGTSANYSTTCGNVWEIDFSAGAAGGADIVPVLNLLLQ